MSIGGPSRLVPRTIQPSAMPQHQHFFAADRLRAEEDQELRAGFGVTGSGGGVWAARRHWQASAQHGSAQAATPVRWRRMGHKSA